MLNIIATTAYVIFLFPCLFAAYQARRCGRPTGHVVTWVVAAMLLLALALSRANGWEDIAREALRSALEQSGNHAQRRLIQAPFMVVAIVCAAAMPIYIWATLSRGRPRRSVVLTKLAELVIAAFVALIALRLVSLHATDRLLYAGPVRLNWVLDGGLSLGLAVLAVLYVRHILRNGSHGPRGTRR